MGAISAALAKRLDKVEPLAKAASGQLEQSVYGVVDRVDNINGVLVPNILRRWKGTIGNMVETTEEPTILLIEKLEPCIIKHKKYKCLFGGRAGTKSIFVMDVLAGDVNSCGSRVYVMRERMKSLKESIYAGITDRIRELRVAGFLPVPSQWEIRHRSAGKFTFGGMQNVIDMKGSFKYKHFLMEEAARTSQGTIDILGPTLRGVDGAELWYVWNPESSNDPMSIEFINPYQADLDRYGYYEDDYHLIIKVGHQDNPWFEHDSSLRQEYEKDQHKRDDGRMSVARFNHIWEGAYNDNVENSVIMPDWFDACIDAHKVLGFEGRGATVAGHDPSDVGNDAKGNCVRTGVVFNHLSEIEAPDANTGFDISCRIAKEHNADSFGWDCDGMGALLREQCARNFAGTKVHTYMYKGSESCHQPKAIFQHSDDYNMKGDRLNEDVFNNRKAQNIILIAQRIKRTYEAVKLKMYHDPDSLISFDSEKISPEMISKLRAEACKMPLKPSDKIAFYTKAEMRAGIKMPDGSKIKIPSPNLFDAVVLSFDESSIMTKVIDKTRRPRPMPQMGITR